MKVSRVLPLHAFLAVSLAASVAAERAAITLYIAPDGNDEWSGRYAAPDAEETDGPLASLEAARETIRGMKQGGAPAGPVRVLLRQGTYYRPEPFILTPEDSGTADAPVTYASAPGERAVIRGGVPITAWRPRADGLWMAKVPWARKQGVAFRQLFVNGTRRTLARSPNEGYFHMVGKAANPTDPATGEEIDLSKRAFRFEPGDLTPSGRPGDANLVIYYNWETALLRIQRVDAKTNTVHLTGPSKWPFTQMGGGRQRYQLQNTFEALDEPGEWFLDYRAGNLYYYPLPGESPDALRAVAPVAKTFLVFRGEPDQGKFVEHIDFEGIAFNFADYDLEPQGHGDWQAAVTMPAVIQADGARHCAVHGCELAHFGSYGIWFRSGCQHNRIVQNHIHDMGCGAVRIGDQGPASRPERQTHHNTVHNNFIHDGGNVYAGAVGIWIGHAGDSRITHNEIRDMNYTGISVGWSWGYGKTQHKRNEIAYNHIHHVGRGMLHDMGAIYTLGLSEGTVLHHNYIHDIWSSEASGGAGGIYPDEGSSGITIENNVVYRTDAGGLTIHYGKDITVRNNIFAFGYREQIIRGRQEKHQAFRFERNIVYFDEGPVWTAWGGGKPNWAADHNLYWNTLGRPLVFLGSKSFAQWQALGLDEHSIVEDPLFVAPAEGDFTLRPGSPIEKIGFQPIDISSAGLVGPIEWRSLPQATPRPDIQFGRRYVMEPRPLADDFEGYSVGMAADFAQTYGEENEARIRVTDETAAAGVHSLKFTDAAGLKYQYNPHLFYDPALREGAATLQFDLMFRSGAVLAHEWRDAGATYHTGPSIAVDEKGALTAGKRKLMDLPTNEWVRFEVTCGLGNRATGYYRLAVTPQGQQTKAFDKLPCDTLFTSLRWLGFISNATQKAQFYLDNLMLGTDK